MIVDTVNPADTEEQLLEMFTEWIQSYHRDGGDFSIEAITAAGESGREALRSGLPLMEAFEAARSSYFGVLAENGSSSIAR